MDSTDDLEKAYRAEATRIRAALAARLGDVGLAEDLVQDAFVEALEHWRKDGLPPNHARIGRRAELPVEMLASAQVSRAQQDPAAQNLHVTILAADRVS